MELSTTSLASNARYTLDVQEKNTVVIHFGLQDSILSRSLSDPIRLIVQVLGIWFEKEKVNVTQLIESLRNPRKYEVNDHKRRDDGFWSMNRGARESQRSRRRAGGARVSARCAKNDLVKLGEKAAKVKDARKEYEDVERRGLSCCRRPAELRRAITDMEREKQTKASSPRAGSSRNMHRVLRRIREMGRKRSEKRFQGGDFNRFSRTAEIHGSSLNPDSPARVIAARRHRMKVCHSSAKLWLTAAAYVGRGLGWMETNEGIASNGNEEGAAAQSGEIKELNPARDTRSRDQRESRWIHSEN
ncbi:hypothetical protein C8R47DRAFT_1078750 [Mycena vitilis]|nr:hypothetical protein C8R47DRAFT_1078750 [Mycena vitilis]